MDKAPLRGFDIFDEEGRAVPVASAARGVSLGRAALLALAQQLLGGEPLHSAVQADLQAIPGGHAELTRRHAELMELAAKDWFKERGLPGVLDKLPAAERVASELPWLQRIRLMEDDVFAGLLRDLTESYLLLADVSPEPGKRQAGLRASCQASRRSPPRLAGGTHGVDRNPLGHHHSCREQGPELPL